MTLYAATTNAGKLREFAKCGRGEGVEVLPLPRLGEMAEPAEDAATFMGNAVLKAVAYSRLAPGLMVMADDSGLEVEALGGAPGVRSARFAEDWEATHPSHAARWMGHPVSLGGNKDERNNELVLRLMESVPEGRRRARFVCALAVALDGEVVLRAEGVVTGELLRTGRGADGFGYDPLFYLPELGMTTAELPAERKWEVSHRGRAFRELLRGLPEANPEAPSVWAR